MGALRNQRKTYGRALRGLVLCGLLASPAVAQEPDHNLLKAAAIGIVTNQNCNGPVFDDVMIISWIYSGRVVNNMTEQQAIDVTKVYVAQILAGITTRQQLHAFCAEMFRINGEPT